MGNVIGYASACWKVFSNVYHAVFMVGYDSGCWIKVQTLSAVQFSSPNVMKAFQLLLITDWPSLVLTVTSAKPLQVIDSGKFSHDSDCQQDLSSKMF